jgi:ferrous iron transport protein B
MGLDWRLIVALLTSFIAKENTIASLGVLFGSASLTTGGSTGLTTGGMGEGAGLAEVLAATFPASTGLAFLVVQMLFVPCVATVAVVKQETGSWWWTLFNLGFLLLVSLIAGIGVFWLAKLAGL